MQDGGYISDEQQEDIDFGLAGIPIDGGHFLTWPTAYESRVAIAGLRVGNMAY